MGSIPGPRLGHNRRQTLRIDAKRGKAPPLSVERFLSFPLVSKTTEKVFKTPASHLFRHTGLM